ncbi:porin [Albibacterium profundi]|uniref:Outer membrane beta-barrel protein n=1 Tax=Albibacterium profundi TaxID=3134906 RepID=A0ABV5CGL8_9SPHI
MKKNTALLLLTTITGGLYAQETETFELSGSVDTYYKYDLSGYQAEDGSANIGTYFGNKQNSISLGMINLIANGSVGKASFVGDLSFGPRGQNAAALSGSIPNSVDGNSFHIQNLYISYQFTDRFSMTAGYMGTFVGYEVISPVGNFNYSTSYLFSSGPFQNAGIKASYTFSEKVALMVGLFNDWNVYHDFNGVSDFGAQLAVTPVEGWSAYLNFLTGNPSGTIVDLTTAYQFTDDFKLGVNVADYSASDQAGGYSGGALYAQHTIAQNFALGLRGEYFKRKEYAENDVNVEGEDILALTVSGNVHLGPLTIIPEFRFDKGSENMFLNSSMAPVKEASQFLIAAVYAF